jgi:hypothetical protein
MFLLSIFAQKYIAGRCGFLFLDQAGQLSDKMAWLLDEFGFLNVG